MAIRHPRSGIAHDLFDALLRFATLAMDVTILAVSFMIIWAHDSAIERMVDRLAARGAQSSCVFYRICMMSLAIDKPNSLEGTTVFF